MNDEIDGLRREYRRGELLARVRALALILLVIGLGLVLAWVAWGGVR